VRAATAAFAEVVAGPHRAVAQVDVLFGGEVIAEGIPVVDGRVDYDRSAQRLARLACSIADPDRVPAATGDRLSPYGYELRVWRGVEYDGPLAAPTYVGRGAKDTGVGAVSPVLPSGIARHDLLLLVAESANEAMTISNANGGTWTQIDQGGTGAAGGTGATRIAVWWSLYNGTQGAPTIADPGNHCVAVVTAFRGVDRQSPIHVATAVTVDTGPTTYTFPAPTTNRANCLVVLAKADDWNNASSTRYTSWTNANLTGLTEAVDDGSAQGNGGGIGIAYGVKATGGAVGSTTVAQHANITVDAGIAIALTPGIRPAVRELLPLGTFPIQRSSIRAVGKLSQITAEDRSRFVSDARFEDDYQVAAATNYVTAITDVLTLAYPSIVTAFPSTTYTTPLLTFAAQSDPWEAVTQMAASLGMEIYFDGLGVCRMRPVPTFSATPVATLTSGVNILDAGVDQDRTTAYNRVVAASKNASTGAQYRGVATDDDPASPTYYDGPFGHKPRFHYSEFYNSDDQCAAGAEAILAGQLGVARKLDFSGLPDVRLETSDVIEVVIDELDIDELHIIETLSVGLGSDASIVGATRTQGGSS
jgi:hypothetical protein